MSYEHLQIRSLPTQYFSGTHSHHIFQQLFQLRHLGAAQDLHDRLQLKETCTAECGTCLPEKNIYDRICLNYIVYIII